jgi:hypothetical protein
MKPEIDAPLKWLGRKLILNLFPLVPHTGVCLSLNKERGKGGEVN